MEGKRNIRERKNNPKRRGRQLVERDECLLGEGTQYRLIYFNLSWSRKHIQQWKEIILFDEEEADVKMNE